MLYLLFLFFCFYIEYGVSYSKNIENFGPLYRIYKPLKIMYFFKIFDTQSETFHVKHVKDQLRASGLKKSHTYYDYVKFLGSRLSNSISVVPKIFLE